LLLVVSLFVVGDISCDVNGSIEFLQHTTTIDKPFFSWNPVTNKETDEFTKDSVAVMGVDILPTELSVESSKHFGEALLPLLKQLIEHQEDVEKLPPALVSFIVSARIETCLMELLVLTCFSRLLILTGKCMHRSEWFTNAKFSVHQSANEEAGRSQP